MIRVHEDPIYVFHRNGLIYVTEDPTDASRWMVMDGFGGSPLYIEYGKEPVPLSPEMILRHLVPETTYNKSSMEPSVRGMLSRKNVSHVKGKTGRPPKFTRKDVDRVHKAIDEVGFNQACRDLKSSKSTVNNFRNKMREKGLWPEG
jgi:hypothetical protein